MNVRTRIYNTIQLQIPFIFVMAGLCLLSFIVYPHPETAMWVGFAIAGYSAIANDSIQTLGTFLSSNKNLPWWFLWLFAGGVLVITIVYGWLSNGGDFAFGRLDKIPQPTSFNFLMLCAPIILLVLTRLKMPVSTTFLLLSVFSSSVIIKKMLVKTFFGYLVAFSAALAVWTFLAYLFHKHEFPSKKYNRSLWRLLQLLSTTFLWSTWIMHDIANVSVFLPRTLNLEQMVIAVGYLFGLIGLLMFWRGGPIQTIITEKTDIVDVRAATIIDFVYALVLLIFKNWSNIPMSTTWVFLGLLAGREIALTIFTTSPGVYWKTAKLVFKDISRAGIGLLISLLLVLFIT